MISFNEYQVAAHKTAVYPQEFDIIYPALKLAGEAGEIAEKIGKRVRDGSLYLDATGYISARVVNNMTTDQSNELVKELGDVLWYVAELSTLLGVRLEDVAIANVEKLQSRSLRGVLIGEGDDR